MGENLAYVYFSEADQPRIISPKRLLRIASKSRKKAFQLVAAWLAVTLTRSRLLHVAVGDEYHTGSCCVGHVSVWATAEYEEIGRVTGCFVIPLSLPIHPIRVRYMRPVTSAWPSLLAWLTFGLSPCHNCVTVACDLLREGGIDTPKRLYSPQQLHTFLEMEGYRWVSKPPSPSVD